VNPCAIRIASVAPSREAASNSSARRRVAGGLRVRALRRGLPPEDIVRAYGTAMCESSRATVGLSLSRWNFLHIRRANLSCAISSNTLTYTPPHYVIANGASPWE
jgi:hypothetical protein